MNITQYMISISNTFVIEDLRVGIIQRLQLHICPVPVEHPLMSSALLFARPETIIYFPLGMEAAPPVFYIIDLMSLPLLNNFNSLMF